MQTLSIINLKGGVAKNNVKRQHGAHSGSSTRGKSIADR